MELFVEPLNIRLNVDSGSNLLDVLRANQLPISYSCMSGRCETCRCRVVSGQVRNSGPEAGRPHTSKDDYVLACQSVLIDNCVIELPDVDEVVVHVARIVKGTVTAIEEATHDIRRLRVKLAKPMGFSSGNMQRCNSRPTTFALTRWSVCVTTWRWSFRFAECRMVVSLHSFLMT